VCVCLISYVNRKAQNNFRQGQFIESLQISSDDPITFDPKKKNTERNLKIKTRIIKQYFKEFSLWNEHFKTQLHTHAYFVYLIYINFSRISCFLIFN
jgi:hypothetical protein